MGVQVIPNLEQGSNRTGLRVVVRREIAPEQQLPLEVPRYLAESPAEEHDGLGCMRGIAMAFGLQAVILIVIFGLWKLQSLLH